jgi:outer membrane protein assembly factor BamB
LDAGTGDFLWMFESHGYILQTPYKYGDAIYTGGSYYNPGIDVDEGGPMKIYALDARDGSPRWVYQAEDGFVKAIYASQEAVTYIAYQDFINGLDSRNGELLWRKDTGNWVPSLSGSEDMVNFGSANTVVYALDMASGESLWEFNIPEGSFNYMLGAPVRVIDDLYFLSQRGDIHALNALDGSSLWSLSTGITARVGLAVSGPWLLIGDQKGRVYAYRSG